MKKTYKSSLLALSVLASFTSCSESESLQQANLSKDKITFHATLDNSWKPLSPSSSSRAAKDAANEEGPIVVPTSYGKPLYLHSLEQDGIYIWSKDGKRITRSGAPLEDGEQERAIQTRGAIKNNIEEYGSFGVTAIYKEGNTNESLFQNGGNPEIAVAIPSNNIWGIQGGRWPGLGEVSFHAFAPYTTNANSPLTFTQDIANGKTQIKYTASNTDIANQPDLIVATNKGSYSKEALDLNFYHALTAVTFSVDKSVVDIFGVNVRLEKLELQGICNKGICDLSLSGTAKVPNAVWTLDKNNKVTYSFDFTDQYIEIGEKDIALTQGAQTLMMIPQTLETGAKVCFTLSKEGRTIVFGIELTGEWKAGTTVNYNLSGEMIKSLQDNFIYDNSWNTFDEVTPNSHEYFEYYPKKTFNLGDEIGVYVVNNNNQLYVDNLKLTKVQSTQENGNSEWQLENGQKILYSKNCRYFCYYPYSYGGRSVNPQATKAHEFFADKINSLQIVEDQSTEEKILAADFQVGDFNIKSDGSFEAKMHHQVGLAVLNLPKTYETAIFKNESYRYYYGDKNYKRPVRGVNFMPNKEGNPKEYFPSIRFDGNTAYNMGEYTPKNDNEINKKFVFVVPFNQSATFKAGKGDGTFNNQWGISETVSVTPTSDNPVVKENVECDVPFQKIVHEYNTQKSVHVFETPEITEYQLECWGSKGQSKNGGVVANAGYSTGIWTATGIKQKLYICCGDMSGYNNGRSKGLNYDAGAWGGGGTHVATDLIGNGETYNYNGDRGKLLLVAGGSGGSAANGKKSGAGGGKDGGDGAGLIWTGSGRAKGATQAAPGLNSPIEVDVKNVAEFGIGGYTYKYAEVYGSQGGGGYNGGGGAPASVPGAGGCGFFSTNLRNGDTKTGVNAPQETGVCRITWTYHRPATLK